MDIHQPKPWRGLREFLKEYVIIVVGVLTALGAEQAVEALHWRHQVAAGQAELKDPFAREVRNAATRAAQGRCVTGRLADLSAILQQAAGDGRLPPLAALGHPAHLPWTVQTWEALLAAGALAHMPQPQMLAYAAIRQRTAYLSGLSDQEEDNWITLDSMAGPGRRLSDIDAEQLRLALVRASATNAEMVRVSAVLSEAVRATGLVEASAFPATQQQAAREAPSAAVCRPMAAGSAR
jgi:hypothetical protein